MSQNSFTNNVQRQTNKEKLTYYIQDDENTMKYQPLDMHGNRFFGQWSKVLTLGKMLNLEIQQKYYNEYQTHYKAKLETESGPICFNQCIGDVNVGAGLSSYEKNCMRECYMKRISAKDDFNMLTIQKLARENIKAQRQTFI